MCKIIHPLRQKSNAPLLPKSITDNLELILTSFVDKYYIRLSNSFLPPHFAPARYIPHSLRKISNSHYLSLCPCSTAPTRLPTHSKESIFKFLAVTLDLNSTDVHCHPSQVNWFVVRHIIGYKWWFLKENWKLPVTLTGWSIFWKSIKYRIRIWQHFNQKNSSFFLGFLSKGKPASEIKWEKLKRTCVLRITGEIKSFTLYQGEFWLEQRNLSWDLRDSRDKPIPMRVTPSTRDGLSSQ